MAEKRIRVIVEAAHEKRRNLVCSRSHGMHDP